MLSEQSKQVIQQTYSQWLSSNGYKPRYGQRAMIGILARTLGAIPQDDEGSRQQDYHDHVCLVEAGTGTGKTIAYAIAGILLARELGKKLVISTATVALQEQLLFKDLPDLQSAGDLDFTYAIAKGRQRYLCLRKLAMRIEEADSRTSSPGLFPDEESELSKETIDNLKSLRDVFNEKAWDGDRDMLEEHHLVQDWPLVAADRASCSGRKCPEFSQCPMFRARDLARDADVIVANHDLVLADQVSGGGNILPEPEQCIFIFDEAHHLPLKSRDHLSAQMNLDAELRRLARSSNVINRASKLVTDSEEGPGGIQALSKTVFQADEALQELLSGILLAVDQLFDSGAYSITLAGELRLGNGLVPDDLQPMFSELADCFTIKARAIKKIMEQLLAVFSRQDGQGQLRRESAYAALGDLLARTESSATVCRDFAQPDPADAAPMARWFRRLEESGGDKLACVSPLSTSSALSNLLWDRCYAAVLTSATLAALGQFEFFMSQVGIGNAANAYRIQGELNFADSTFYMPPMRSEPGQTEQHTLEVIGLVRDLSAPCGGTLVLFSSRKQMEAVYEGLDPATRACCLVQGASAKKVLVQRHRDNVDNGGQSILFGLASFAEGLDLPGDYCREVIIAKLPFAVPDSPVDEAMSEWIESRGGNPFWDITVPNASIKLLQACGRLLRKESDTGRVSLLDSRIRTRRYGKLLRDSLPPFRQVEG